jgi:hemin uptake protein HemP
VPSAQLLGAHHAIEIEHNGQRYRLQSTRSGKLILTK